MAFLTIQPVWSNREPTAQEIEVTNALHRIYQTTVTGSRQIGRQVNAVRNRLGDQPIGAFTGTAIDETFKSAVRSAKARGALPPESPGDADRHGQRCACRAEKGAGRMARQSGLGYHDRRAGSFSYQP
jgi:hypothetical protein